MKCTPGSARINRKMLSLCLAWLGLKGITESRAGGVLTKALLLQAEAPATEVREKLVTYLSRIKVVTDVTLFTIGSQCDSQLGHSVTHNWVTV